MTDRQRNGFILLLVVGLIAASRVVIAHPEDVPRPRPQGRRPARLPGRADAADAAGDPGRAAAGGRHHAPARRPARRRRAEIQTSGSNQITVGLPNVNDTSARRAAGRARPRGSTFYDWEANALTPNGKPVASQLQTQDPTALTDQPGVRLGRAGLARRRQHAALRGGAARGQAARPGQQGQRAHRARVLHVRGARQRRVRSRGRAPPR